MNILISTPTYPPALGGPAQYSKNLAQAMREVGEDIKVRTYGWEIKLPTGLRHLVHFFKILPAVWWAEAIIVLDTYSVGVPVYWATRIVRRPYVIRIGGDFLWEWYVERTKKKVLLREFYDKGKSDGTVKEKVIFYLTKKVLARADKLVFSTDWQRKIWQIPYEIDLAKTAIIENYYDFKNKIDKKSPSTKKYIWAGRQIFLKNVDSLKMAFLKAKRNRPEISLEILSNMEQGRLFKEIGEAYAVVIPSLSDISPNLALEALSRGVPVILTKETGVRDRVGDIFIYVDPVDIDDIADKIVYLSDESNYARVKEKIASFNFKHSYDEIALEFIKLIKR